METAACMHCASSLRVDAAGWSMLCSKLVKAWCLTHGLAETPTILKATEPAHLVGLVTAAAL